MDEHYERMRVALLVAIADHEHGVIDNAGLRAALQGVLDALDSTHAGVREALFEADVALEYAQEGRPVDGAAPSASLRRVRRNLREAMG